MTHEEITALSAGKYAAQRRMALEKYAPEMYREMRENGSLEEHLANVQETVSDYVEMCAEKYRHTEEYIRADERFPEQASRYLSMTVLEAEEAASRMWIYGFDEE